MPAEVSGYHSKAIFSLSYIKAHMNRSLILLPLAFALAACSPPPSDQVPAPATAPTSAAPAATAQVEVAPTTMIHADPARLPDCSPAVVTLKWDVYKDKPEIKTVKIYTGKGTLFVHTGAVGKQETGPWVKPGSVFVLKSGSDDTELERLTIGGPVCD